jgi:hypothetical protein
MSSCRGAELCGRIPSHVEAGNHVPGEGGMGSRGRREWCASTSSPFLGGTVSNYQSTLFQERTIPQVPRKVLRARRAVSEAITSSEISGRGDLVSRQGHTESAEKKVLSSSDERGNLS